MATPKTKKMKARLLPVLKRPDGRPARDLVPDELQVGLSVTTLRGEVPVDSADLSHWSLTFEEAMAFAMENLRALSNASQLQDTTVPGMQIYLPGDTDAASRALLLQELLTCCPAEGVLFAVPTADQLLIVPLDDFRSLTAIRVLVTAAHLATQEARHVLSNQIFWATGDEIRHIPVVHQADNVDILAPPDFLDTVERLASMAFIGSVGEA